MEGSGLNNHRSFSKSCDQAYFQTQKPSMAENNFPFLRRQKAYRLRNRVSQKKAIERHLILVKGERTYVIYN